jgi:hypothetical protein
MNVLKHKIYENAVAVAWKLRFGHTIVSGMDRDKNAIGAKVALWRL